MADTPCMSQNTISSSPQLTQALAQLRQLAPQSELAKAGVEVLVKHLAGDLVNLVNTTTRQNITLAKTDLSGTLHSSQTYEVKMIQRGQNTVLQFIPQNSDPPVSAPLSTKQLETLLKLPANQLLGSAVPQSLLKVDGRITASSHNQLTLAITGSQPKQSLSIDIPNTKKFTIGSSVTVELKPVAKNWHVTVTPTPAKQSAPLPAAQLIAPKPSDRVNLSASQALPLLKTLLTQSQGANARLLPVDNKAVQPLMQSGAGIGNKNPMPDVAKLTGPIGLQIQPDGKGTLVELRTRPSGEITASKSNIASLSTLLQTLDIPLSKPVIRRLSALLTTAGTAAPAGPIGPGLSQHSSPPVSPVPGQLASGVRTPAVGSGQTVPAGVMPGNTKVQDNHIRPRSAATENVTPVTQHKDVVVKAGQMSDTVKTQALGVLHSLLRVVQARAELPSDSLQRILGALADPQLANEPSIKKLSEQLGQQVKQGLPQGKEQDASQIRQLLAQPTLSLNPLQILTPVPGQGLIGGLLALVQISLASRLSRSQPGQTQRLADAVSPLAGGEPGATAKVPSGVSPKGLSEFAQVEQKHQLLKEISRLFAGHQTSKLGNAEQLLQGQDTFYYTLPSAFGDNLRDIELLLKREQQSPEEQAQGDEPKNRHWHLTMKLSVGELGELLTKAKLKQDNLEIDFYTSNESTRNQVLNFLPLLKKRFTALGIDVAKSTCQLGKIPTSLQQKPYHLVQTKV